MLVVASSDREMETLAAQLGIFTPQAEVLIFPAWDCLPYDRISPRQQIMAQRMATVARLLHPQQRRLILVTTINALTQKLTPRSLLTDSSLSCHVGGKLDLDALTRYLAANGYTRVGKVMEAGEFAIRGSIVDLFPSGFEYGCRIDLFGDEIESIQFFDPLTQRSTGEKQEGLTLNPVSEVMLTQATIDRFRSRYREAFGAVSKADPLYEAISSSRAYPGMEHWLPLFYEKLDTLYAFLPADVLTFFCGQAEISRLERQDVIVDYFNARQQFKQKDSVYHPLPPEQLYLVRDGWGAVVESRDIVYATSYTEVQNGIPQAIRRGRDFAHERRQGQNPYELAATYIRQQQEKAQKVLVACMSEGSRQRLEEKLNLPEIRYEVMPLTHGFIAPELTVIAEQDILGERQGQVKRKRKHSEQFLAEAANFSEGELIVHREHGIGRFVGLVTMEVQGISRDCLKLIYADDDKLFLPVENVDLLSRYGSGDTEEGDAKLDKLGGASWQARKARMKERIKLAAEALLKTAAERELAEGTVLTSPAGLYEEFCNRFPYMETEDQEKAIAEVLEDLSSGKPTDRLICGDVGFGKTEVAMRAAFVAAMAQDNPVQVAVIAPTTLLARQHFKTFSQRFEGFPLKVRQFSRLATTKEMKEGLEGLADGSVQIAVGTHALLAERTKFKNLGLLIVDEEQHFGVKQKEKLKSLRSNIHVLTLSATPIPRTMQMALAGVRELSLITTPPVDRLAVRTFVSPYDAVAIREALLREYHRGGQSFYVTPYISDIAELRFRIQDLVPELKVAVAHGQLPPSELDSMMNDFYDGKYDVLLSTAIIESGIDIPTANTMIINRADRFGLAQLYQLRGRVGRSKTRAYAYLTLPHGRNFSANAMKRLEVMQTLDTLGAGFTVASHDMDIRGFGNLVGEEQSGHIREVGVELYQQMLEEAVQEARRRKKGEKSSVHETHEAQEWRPQINLGLSVLIPETYVQDLDIRLGLYRRAATLRTAAEIEDFELELADRFGRLPQEAEHFLLILKLKLLCVEAGLERLDAGPKGVVLSFYQNQVANPQDLLAFINRRPRHAKLRADHKLVLSFDIAEETKRLSFVQEMLAELVLALTLQAAA